MEDNSYQNWYSFTDKALLSQIGAYVKHHRLMQNKTQDEVSYAAGISRSTLSLLERGQTVTLATLLQVLRVLEQLHVMKAFEVIKMRSPLVLAREEQEQRYRARKKGGAASSKSDW